MAAAPIIGAVFFRTDAMVFLFRHVRPLLLPLLLAWACVAGAADLPREPVVLQLKWQHQFQFAGYYAAHHLGYYRAAGLDVRFRTADPGTDPVAAVLDGRADFGVGTSSLLLQRQQGQPLVVLAAIFQHSALSLLMRRDRPEASIHDLAGRRLMLEPHSEELLAYLKREGVPIDGLQQLPHSFDARDLIDGRVGAMSAYLTDEPYFLERAGIPFLAFTPRAAGIDFYGDNLFTTEQHIARHPRRVQAFLDASLQGWHYALAHPEEIVELILREYSPRHDRDYLLQEARRMQPLIRPDLVEIGYMSRGRWQHIADTYAELGMLPRGASLDGFLYRRDPPLPAWVVWSGLAALGAILLGGLVSAATLRINRGLQHNNRRLREAQSALGDSERRYRLLAEHAGDVIWTLDPGNYRFTYVSPSVQRLRGLGAEQALAESLDEAFLPASALAVRRAGERLLAASADGFEAPAACLELEQPRRDGSTVWTETSLGVIRDDSGQGCALLGITRDISERKRLRDELDRLAHYDELTGLPNRSLFFDRLEQTLLAAARERARFALLFIDLDGFKEVNDQHGHEVGDLLLQQVSARLSACVRASDTVARMGGDEFAALLRNIHQPEDAANVAQKIVARLSQPFDFASSGGPTCRIGASIGIALYPEHGHDGEQLLARADRAMYQVKRSGKNSHACYHVEV